MAKVKRGKVVRYNKWGYIFLIPFVAVYVLFQLIPLFRTDTDRTEFHRIW